MRLLLCLLVALLAAACGDSGSSAPPAGPVTGVARSERVWTDGHRAAGLSPERRLRVLVWQPEPRRERPLVLLAHGFGGLPEKFDAFARDLAHAGYEVAAPAFPLTNERVVRMSWRFHRTGSIRPCRRRPRGSS
jgi:predicted dienelactone hydrolase